MDVWIIKLGGSVITAKKTGHPIIKKVAIARLCADIAQAASANPQRRFIVLHGAGSLGHPLVFTHNLRKASLVSQNMPAVSQIVRNMRRLTDTIANELVKHEVNPLPLQTSSMVSGKPREKFPKVDILQQILEAGGIPILSGDITVTNEGVINVLSADAIAVRIAQAMPITKMLFVSDTPGVFATFPPTTRDHPLQHLSRQQLQALTRKKPQATNHDVTGGMVGKLQALLPLTGTEVVIFNGQQAGTLAAALQSKPVGTTIQL